MLYNKGNNILFKKIKDLLHKEDKCEVNTRVINPYKEYDLPILESNELDDKYCELFDSIINIIEKMHYGTTYCIKCGITTSRIVNRILESYKELNKNNIVLTMYEDKYNISDYNDKLYGYTEILFTSRYSDEVYYTIDDCSDYTVDNIKEMKPLQITVHTRIGEYINNIISFSLNKSDITMMKI